MNKKNTSDRLKQIMDSRSLKQVDILRLAAPYCQKYNVKMNKSDLSQYLSGKAEPRQDKLFILGSALGVSEAWLMGFDVPIERNTSADHSNADEDENQLLSSFRQLNRTGKGKVVDYAADLTKLPNYTEPEAEDNTESNPISEEPVLIAAHNGHAEEPGQLELMNRDVALAKEIHRIIHSKQ